MNNVRTAIIALAALALLPLKTAAQDLNPTVEVTNAYEVRHIDATKPLTEMAVPDSVLNFRLDFDYSVSPRPYAGSYDFTPYIIDVQPEAYAEKDRMLFLRLGAGYSLHPTADLVFTPRFKTNAFSLNVYGSHRSYIGKYRAVTASTPSSSDDPVILKGDRHNKYSGWNTWTTAGINGRADWYSGFFTFDVGYTGYANRDTSFRRSFDMLRAALRVASRKDAPKYFYYDVSAAYTYGTDNTRCVGSVFTVPCADGSSARLREHDISLDAVLGPVFSESSRLLFDVRLDLSDYLSYFDSYAGKFSITPKYTFRRNRWLFDLGAEISVLMGGDRTVWPSSDSDYLHSASMHNREGQYVYPDILVGFDAIRKHLNIYLSLTGGDDINRYSDLVERNPFLSLNHAWNCIGLGLLDDYDLGLMNNTVEKLNARLGLKGSIASRLSYNLYGGYAIYDGLPLDAVVVSDDFSTLSPALSYTGRSHEAYATLELGWHSKDITADGHVSCVYSNASKKGFIGFIPSPLTGGFNIVYNWRGRIYAGIHGTGAARRKGYAACAKSLTDTDTSIDYHYISAATDASTGSAVLCRIPGWFDLGLSGEYRFNRTVSVWLHASNLLNQSIQLSPLYTTSGISFTAGITLNL